MPVSLLLTCVSTLAFTIQLLIFVYLYPSHRVRFFNYLVWAWGFFVLSKGLKLIEAIPILPASIDLGGLMSAAFVIAQFFIAAAALAYRYDYAIGPRYTLLGTLSVLGAVWTGDLSQAAPLVRESIAVVFGAVQFAAGLAFWPRSAVGVRYRGARLLAVSFWLWGVHMVVSKFLNAAPGTTTHFVVHATFVCLYFSSTFAIIIMVLDRARSEMRSLKELNERLVDGLGEGLELVDGTFAVRHANRWMLEHFGPVGGRRCYEILTADGRPCRGCPLERRQEIAEPVWLEVDGVAGRRFQLSCSPVRQPDGQVFLLERIADVTEQARLRARLSEAERLAAAGELAAGMAHEIRNPLAAIVNATTLLDGPHLLTSDERMSTLDAVRKEARRLNRILSDFLIFARPRAPKLLPGDIREVVEHVAALIRDDPVRARLVELRTRVDAAVPSFAFDPDQLTQVLLNVALNGIEAMGGRGRLSLEVGRVNGEVLIAVADTGRGIAAEDRGRVFEPFFSKKPGGTGLGLTIARRIVDAHGGHIDLDSTPGQGTRFTIALPVATA
jgi:two-component system, NtrC family, sensor histidine kinase HydH